MSVLFLVTSSAQQLARALAIGDRSYQLVKIQDFDFALTFTLNYRLNGTKTLVQESNLINWSKSEELMADVGKEAFSEIVDVFLEEVEGALANLPENAPVELAKSMHFLKGCALNLGFDRLANECSENERSLGSGSVAQVDIKGLIETYRTSKSLFLERFS